MSITRRVFLRDGALAAVGTAALPAFVQRTAWGAAQSAKAKRLVVIFQRGAADGLNIVVPYAEPAYYAMRPSINIPRKSLIELDGFFGLHPALETFQPLWKQRHLAVVHAAGSPVPTRSHFEAQDFMESGMPGVHVPADGWLNRALRGADHSGSGLRAIALGPSLPRILAGSAPVLALNNLSNVGVEGKNSAPLADRFEAMHDSVLHGTQREAFEAVKMLRSADPAKYKPAPGANYPRTRFADSLKQLCQLIKGNLGVQVAFADIGGWDHHVNEGSTQGQMANMLREFSQSLSAFWIDLGDLAEDTVIITMSEFGRAARENSTRGTDHGYAQVMFVMGGPVKGGKVYGRWPGLDPSQLYAGRDLAVTTDFRRVLGEAVSQHLGNKALGRVFPGFENRPQNFLGYLG
ncbi:MAG TPA: DUF1501 domain-containing protein [Terriglobales bacterium]|nr:DUF1501 domain-containing protein [Terriglobales bacterium]